MGDNREELLRLNIVFENVSVSAPVLIEKNKVTHQVSTYVTH